MSEEEVLQSTPTTNAPPRMTPTSKGKSRRTSKLIEWGDEDDAVREDDNERQVDASTTAAEAATTTYPVTKEATSWTVPYHHHHSSTAASRAVQEVSWYHPPTQRQKWGDAQVLPHIQWGDLFFDLFYVAMAYNVSNILVETPSGIGFLYFLGCFLGVWHVWKLRLGYDARFVHGSGRGDDVYHRLEEILGLVALATAIVHTRGGVATLSYPSQHMDMIWLAAGLLACHLLLGMRWIEVDRWGVGQRDNLVHLAKAEGKVLVLGILFYAAALIVAAVEYRKGDRDGADDDGHRFLAESSSPNHIPIILILTSTLLHQLIRTIQVVCFMPNDGSHKQYTIPMNIDFCIHRDGEWTMLMLGESIMSLLIVDLPDENSDYYVTLYCSITTMMALHVLHFRSQPRSASEHVLRKDKNRGMLWNIFWHVYSASLIAFGSALTLFVLAFNNPDAVAVANGFAPEEGDGAHRHLIVVLQRELASSSALYPPKEMKQRAVNIFSISLAMIFVALDVMSYAHVGLDASKQRCFNQERQQYNAKGIALVVLRVILIVFVGTMSIWNQSPEQLAVMGLGVTVLQIVLRKLGESNLRQVFGASIRSALGSKHPE